MISRFHPLLCLGLLLVSCDNPPEAATNSETSAPSPRVTKTARPASGELPNQREKLRAGLTKAAGIVSPEERNRALAAAVWDALDLEPELAREGMQQLAAGSEEKARLIEHVAMRLAEQDADEAVRWAGTFETDEEKSLAFGKIALVLSQEDPARAAQILSDSGVAGRDFDVAVVEVVQRWAQVAPEDALAWVSLFDPGEVRSASLREAISIWAAENPQAAFSWVAAIQNETIRPEATQGTAEAILEQPENVQAEWLVLATPAVRESFEKLKAQAEATDD
jgi:hypothetical protein